MTFVKAHTQKFKLLVKHFGSDFSNVGFCGSSQLAGLCIDGRFLPFPGP